MVRQPCGQKIILEQLALIIVTYLTYLLFLRDIKSTGITKTIQYAQVRVPYPLAIRSINPNFSARKMDISKRKITI